ncbi:MAG: hypothetical protein IPP74_08370 [Alphaproteobacteria bacterium]|nr:hypothetical protein [Alphaproteobacteria bacterium]
MANQSSAKIFTITLLIAVVAVIGYYVLNAPDRRTAGQKIGDAVDELPNGADKAARQLEDRTPGDKLHDAANNATDDVKKATNQPRN